MIRKNLSHIGRRALRYPFCTVCIVLSVVLAGANVWLRLDLIDLFNRQQDAAREGDSMLKMIARGSQMRTELAAVRAASRRITENLLTEKNIPENFWYFYKIEQDTRAKLIELQQRPALLQDSNVPSTYKRVPYALKFSGPFRAVIASLQRLESGPRLGRIDGFQLQRLSPLSDDLVLQLDFELLGFP